MAFQQIAQRALLVVALVGLAASIGFVSEAIEASASPRADCAPAHDTNPEAWNDSDDSYEGEFELEFQDYRLIDGGAEAFAERCSAEYLHLMNDAQIAEWRATDSAGNWAYTFGGGEIMFQHAHVFNPWLLAH